MPLLRRFGRPHAADFWDFQDKDLLWRPSVCHEHNMTRPTLLVLNEHRSDTCQIGAIQNRGFGNHVLTRYIYTFSQGSVVEFFQCLNGTFVGCPWITAIQKRGKIHRTVPGYFLLQWQAFLLRHSLSQTAKRGTGLTNRTGYLFVQAATQNPEYVKCSTLLKLSPSICIHGHIFLWKSKIEPKSS